jgi:hypothetical protein
LGGAIQNCVGGVIQNNIFRNNRADSGSALNGCNAGVIRNNVFYSNKGIGGTIVQCSSSLINNTIYDNTTNLSFCTGTIENNIIWGTIDNPMISSTSSTPNFCLIKNYDGPGAGNIAGDPKLVDPANGDFRLQSDSPCIDAGKASSSVKADINNVQRGLKGVQSLRGDGSAVDIGAYEFLPQPIAVWFPGGAPGALNPGQTVTVAWQMDPSAGSQIGLQLVNGPNVIADFGFFFSNPGEATLTLPAPVGYGSAYAFAGTSVFFPTLTGQTPPFTVLGVSAARPQIWRNYR